MAGGERITFDLTFGRTYRHFTGILSFDMAWVIEKTHIRSVNTVMKNKKAQQKTVVHQRSDD